jgi:hypothetical protein
MGQMRDAAVCSTSQQEFHEVLVVGLQLEAGVTKQVEIHIGIRVWQWKRLGDSVYAHVWVRVACAVDGKLRRRHPFHLHALARVFAALVAFLLTRSVIGVALDTHQQRIRRRR